MNPSGVIYSWILFKSSHLRFRHQVLKNRTLSRNDFFGGGWILFGNDVNPSEAFQYRMGLYFEISSFTQLLIRGKEFEFVSEYEC